MDRPPANLGQVVVAACCLVASRDDIDAMQVCIPRQPAYGELMRYRAVAEAHGCTMTVRRSGDVALRFQATPVPLRPQDESQSI
jgi:hypothetical protein